MGCLKRFNSASRLASHRISVGGTSKKRQSLLINFPRQIAQENYWPRVDFDCRVKACKCKRYGRGAACCEARRAPKNDPPGKCALRHRHACDSVAVRKSGPKAATAYLPSTMGTCTLDNH